MGYNRLKVHLGTEVLLEAVGDDSDHLSLRNQSVTAPEDEPPRRDEPRGRLGKRHQHKVGSQQVGDSVLPLLTRAQSRRCSSLATRSQWRLRPRRLKLLLRRLADARFIP